MSGAGRHDFTFSLAYSRIHIASVRATETQNSTRCRRQASSSSTVEKPESTRSETGP